GACSMKSGDGVKTSGATAPDVVAVSEQATADAESGASRSFLDWLFYSDGFHPPSITEFFPPAILGDGTWFEFNRISLVRVVAAVVLLTIFWLVARRASVVPTRGQAMLEILLDFVRVQIVEQVMSKENAKRFLPFLTTL